MQRFAAAALGLALASCGVRAPAPIDVAALVAKRGPIEARRDLEIRILADPRDVQARLGLAALDETIGRPSEALAALEAVENLGGPAGIRWHDADRARLAKLYAARGRVRLARGAASAQADFDRAIERGGEVTAEERIHAKVVAAIVALRHVDASERARGRALLLDAAAAAEHAGTVTFASEAEREAWAGARQTATAGEHGAFGAWLWSLGANREAFEQLSRWRRGGGAADPALDAAFDEARAWWWPVEGARGVSPRPAGTGTIDAPREPVLLAASVAAGEPPRVAAAVRHAIARSTIAEAGAPALAAIARAYVRDPAIADRLGRDFVAEHVDAAAADAALGALFDAIGDPPRARAAWQAAAEGGAEPSFVRGLAEACARAGDAPAARIHATAAAAASGDPAIVWLALARTLEERGLHVDALDATRGAIDLAGPAVIGGALALAEAASRELHRDAQATSLAERAAHVPRVAEHAALASHRARPTAATVAALWVAARAHPRDAAIAIELYGALAADDPRRPTITRALVELAGDGDPDPSHGLAAARALMR